MSRRTIHNYDGRPVDAQVVRKALEASLRAPNHKLTNPWRYTLVGPQTRSALVELAVEVKNEKRPLSPSQEKVLRRKYEDCPQLVFVSQRLHEDPKVRKEDYAAIASALMIASLVLWEHGLGTKWSTGAITWSQKTYDLLKIDQDQEEIVGMFWIGYPAMTPDPPRKPLEEVLRTTD